MCIDIDDMLAGPGMNALVAVEAMGWFERDGILFSPYHHDWSDDELSRCGGNVPPDYSRDILAAWPLVEKFGLALIPQSIGNGKFRWFACDIEAVKYRGFEIAIIPIEWTEHSADTAPLAICRAVLSAVRVKRKLEVREND